MKERRVGDDTMKRANRGTGTRRGRGLRWVAAGLLTFGIAACDESPQEVYVGMATAAQMGDLDGFLDGFTKESQPLIQAQISLSEAYDLKADNPVRQLVFDAVDKVETEGDVALLDVSSGGRKERLKMVKTEDGWRIDVKALAEFWDAEKKSRR